MDPDSVDKEVSGGARRRHASVKTARRSRKLSSRKQSCKSRKTGGSHRTKRGGSRVHPKVEGGKSRSRKSVKVAKKSRKSRKSCKSRKVGGRRQARLASKKLLVAAVLHSKRRKSQKRSKSHRK
jgi:hypothetical protein